MNIIGLEVLESPGILETAIAPPGKQEITYGQTLHVTISFGYRGKALKVTLYGTIGNRKAWILGGFDQIIQAENPDINLPESPTDFTPCLESVDIPITPDISPGENYDLQCKIKEYPDVFDEVDDVITITGIPPTFKLLEETIYPYAYVYDGKCDVTTFTCTSIPFTPSSWVSGKMAADVAAKVREAGGRIMEMRVYVDENLLRPWTNWRIEVVTRPETGVAMALGVWWLGPVIILALIAVIVIATPWVIKSIVAAFKRNPALEDVKPGWKKDTLILTIQDSEEYWKRTPTPVETLEGMSEEALREYLDKIAEEEVPVVPGLGIAIAVAAVLGLGALALVGMSMAKPKGAE